MSCVPASQRPVLSAKRLSRAALHLQSCPAWAQHVRGKRPGQALARVWPSWLCSLPSFAH